VVSTQNDAMLGLRDLFGASKIAQVVLDEEFTRDSFDFRTVIARIIAAKVDAVYVLLFPPQSAPFMRQLREQGFKKDAFGVHNVEDPHEVAASDGAMIGMWLANGDETAGEDYPAQYLRRFGVASALGGGSGFDAAKMFI
jgi:branched-chain amino acid transport system substrate-binding protein